MIPFVKAHACGNDFLVIQEDLAGVEARDALTRRLCHRNQSIGADGVEFLTWEDKRQARIRLHNADGSIAEISGNGTRCAAAWIAYETQAGPGDEIVLETDAGRRVCRIDDRTGQTLASASSVDKETKKNLKGGGNIAAAKVIGKAIAERAKSAGVTKVVFDRGGYKYHGRVKALADAAREAGLQF